MSDRENTLATPEQHSTAHPDSLGASYGGRGLSPERKEYLRLYRIRNQEKRRLYNLQWRKDHIEHARELNRQKNAKRKGYFKEWESRNRDNVLAKYVRHNAKRKEKTRQYDRERLKDPVFMARKIARVRARAAKKKSLTVEDTQKYELSIRLKKRVKCYYCGRKIPGRSCHIDHVVPINSGGATAIYNLVPACPSCNLSKSDKPVNDFIKNGNLLLPLG